MRSHPTFKAHHTWKGRLPLTRRESSGNRSHPSLGTTGTGTPKTNSLSHARATLFPWFNHKRQPRPVGTYQRESALAVESHVCDDERGAGPENRHRASFLDHCLVEAEQIKVAHRLGRTNLCGAKLMGMVGAVDGFVPSKSHAPRLAVSHTDAGRQIRLKELSQLPGAARIRTGGSPENRRRCKTLA